MSKIHFKPNEKYKAFSNKENQNEKRKSLYHVEIVDDYEDLEEILKSYKRN